MKVLTKRILLSALMFCMVICCAMLTISLKASADDGVTFDDAKFTMKQEAAVRIGSNDNATEFDYEKNGIRFTAEMNASEYEALQEDAAENGYIITYGILIAPKDYHDANPLNEANVFGENKVYDFLGGAGKKKIANITTKELAQGNGVYYYNASMVNLKTENVARQFVAVSYMMKQAPVNVEAGQYAVEYKFCENNVYMRSMSYVAQKALEKDYSDTIKTALQESYIDEQTALVNVECQKIYGTINGDMVTGQIELALGSVSADAVTQALADKDMINGFTLSNADALTGKTVYADDMTETLTLNYQAEQSSENVEGFYLSNNAPVLVLKEDGAVKIVSEDESADGNYVLYKDGTVAVTVEDETTLGSYDFDNGTLSVKDDDSTLVYGNAYTVVANTYYGDGVTVELRENGTVAYGDEEGTYGFVYEETGNTIYVEIKLTTDTKQLELTVEDGKYAIDGLKSLGASKAAYSKFAGYYNCTTGTDKDLVFKFNTDGTVLKSGEKVGTFVLQEQDGAVTVLVKINGANMTSEVTYNSTAYGYDTAVVTLGDMTLVRGDIIGLNPYDIFAKPGDSTNTYSYFYTDDPITGSLKGRVTLYTTKTESQALIEAGYADYYDFGFRADGSGGYTVPVDGVSYAKGNSAYKLIPTSATGGVFKVVHKGNTTIKTLTLTYGIADDGRLFVTFNGSGWVNGTWTLYKQETSMPTEKASELSLVDTFASSEGTVYGNTSNWRLGALKLFNTVSTQNITKGSGDGEWYHAEYYAGSTLTHPKLAYRLTELENGVGIIEIWHSNDYAIVTLRYGIINGVRWVDMRGWSPNGSDQEKNIKMYDNINSTNLTPAVTEQIANYQTVYENIGKDE